MENKTLRLKFRVIALVSSDGTPATKAQALFQKFKDNNVKKYLNENSLNQAGYEVEIENQAMFDSLGTGDLDDYFYAFDKTYWTTKNLFTANHTKQKTRTVISWDPNGNPIKTEITNNETVDVIAYEGDIDGVTAEEYKKKLISKYNKSYQGGLIILADYEAKPGHVGAFSQSFPLEHDMLFVYSSNSNEQNDGQIYAHEIGHMLGLTHTFITINPSTNTDNTKEYRDKKDEINNYIEKNITSCKKDLEEENKKNQINVKNKALKPLKDQFKKFTPFTKYYIKKMTLISCLEHSNIYIQERIKYRREQVTYYTNKINDKTEYTIIPPQNRTT
ncbi:MAG TPA: M43 family zinc metalloprotease [Flavobacterium sp.]